MAPSEDQPAQGLGHNTHAQEQVLKGFKIVVEQGSGNPLRMYREPAVIWRDTGNLLLVTASHKS